MRLLLAAVLVGPTRDGASTDWAGYSMTCRRVRPYSERNDSTGSVFAARTAGSVPARNAIPITSTMTVMIDAGGQRGDGAEPALGGGPGVPGVAEPGLECVNDEQARALPS